MNQIVNMIVNIVMRQLIHRGVNKGFDMAAKGMEQRKKPAPQDRPAGVSAEDEAEMAAMAEQKQGKNPWDKNAQKRLRQTMNVSRKIGPL